MLRRLVFVLVVVGVMLPAAACVQSPDEALVTGLEAQILESGLLDEYEAYIKADPQLKEGTKKIRLGTAAGVRELLKDARAAIKKEGK
jgi:hypothetical protein